MLPCLALLLAAAVAAPPDTLIVPVEPVVVTGTRVPVPALRAPAAISVVDSSRFDVTRTISLKDALTLVPGVFTQSRGGAQDVRVTIRGFGARGNGDRSNAGSMRGIRVMVDGIPVTEPDGRTSLDLVNVGATDRVEVARSNSSTLYGNASGGVVHLLTNLDVERPYLTFRERAGSFGFRREQLTGGFRIGEGTGIVTLMNSTYDGWRAHSQSSTTMLQSRLRAPLGERSKLGVLLDLSSNFNRFPGALTQAQLDADPTQANPVYVARDERRFNRVARLGLTLDQQLTPDQDLQLTTFVEPKVLQRSERNRFRDFTRYHVGGSGTWTLQTAPAPDIAMVTTAGGDEAFQDGSILFYGLEPDGARATNVVANKREGASNAGAFIQHRVTWKDRWAVTGAVRLDHIWYISEDRIDPGLNSDKTFRRVTPKGSIAWLADQHTVYAAFGGGVEAPAFNEIDPPAPFDTLTALNPFLDAMHSTSVELGAKGRLARLGGLGTLQYDVALFRIDVANEIVPFNGGAYFFTAGESHRQGLEVGLGWNAFAGFAANGALTLMEAEYDTYVNDLGDFSGKRVAGIPGAIVAGSLQYDSAWNVSAAVGVQSVSGYFADDANQVETESYAEYDARLSWRLPMGDRTLSAFVSGSNLTDEKYVESVFINGVAGQDFEPGLPRSWSAGLNFTLR